MISHGPRAHRRRAARWAAPGLAVLVGVTMTGCGGSGSGAVTTGGVTFVAADHRSAPVRIVGTTLDGRRLDSLSLRGSPVVINVWESDCGPCRAEAKDLQTAYAEVTPQRVGFVGLTSGEVGADAARAFVRAFGITFPSILDPGNGALLSLRGAVAPNAVPTTLVLDDRGRVAARAVGQIDTTTLVDLVTAVRTDHFAPTAS